MVDLEAKCNKMEFEETELRLGLNYGKRGYDEMVDLKLNLSSSTNMVKSDDHEDHHEAAKNLEKAKNSVDSAKPPPPKAQVVGWPPVRSFRKNITMTAVPKTSGGSTEESGGGAAFVKVSMDGAPYLRKVDLSMYKTYSELSHALTKMFSSFTATANLQCGLEGKENSQVDHVPTYQDKDGDWMLVGDVPWEMFVESCKRLRIMKGAEAKGLAPRAMEKCKTRS